MTSHLVKRLHTALDQVQMPQDIGRITSVQSSVLKASGLQNAAKAGDRVTISRPGMARLMGEIIQMQHNAVTILPDESPVGVRMNATVALLGPATLAPSENWIGRIVDPDGRPLDGAPILGGAVRLSPVSAPPPAANRHPLGHRLNTGIAVLNTLLPIVRGQRLGLFAGSGVGKSNLLGKLAQSLECDVVVLALIGERGRELRSFVADVLGEAGMKRAVVVAATSDQSPLQRRKCAHAAMTVAEYFRDQGKHVLFLADSITRFAEAHREVATAAGEVASLRGYPASTSHAITSLCERAGPGTLKGGDITAVFSVLVAGSDMEEPIADILRGVLDGHVVLDRQIAERGRYPAIDVLRSVSRSLPNAASATENKLIAQARFLLGTYERSETMVRAGLYNSGTDPNLDAAIQAWPELDQFFTLEEPGKPQDSFDKLALILRRSSVALNENSVPNAH